MERRTDRHIKQIGRKDGIVVECVDESTDNSKVKETRHVGVSTHSQSPSSGNNFKDKTKRF
jgi:hypothetical protein